MIYLDETEEEIVKPTYPFAVAVSFRDSGKPYSFGTYDTSLSKGDYVIVQTSQGLELGQCRAPALSVEKYGLPMPEKPILRVADQADKDRYAANLVAEEEALLICGEEIADLGLDMHLLSAQYTLDRYKILFIYLADQRVDFRELLKRLNYRLRCRIELRQIGERDKARLVGGIGLCGMECCCRRFKEHFDVISINMAKDQMLALNIDKLSGVCGKLMCCLKYEDSDYKEMTEGLPKMGSQIEYEGDIYRLTGMNVMEGRAKLENHETVLFVTLDDLRKNGIPRKGVITPHPKTEEGEMRTVRRNIHKESSSPTVSMEVELPRESQSHKEARHSPKASSGKRERHRERSARRNESLPDNPNVTVRTFGKKKTDDS